MTDPFAPVAIEPKTIMVGQHYAWTVPETFDPTLYTLAAAFTQGPAVKSLAATDNAGVWTFTATRAFTGDLAHGRVLVDLILTRIADGESKIVRSYAVQCFSNDADRRSHARLMVEKIESILAGRADSDVESYSIKSRQITKMSVKELMDWREYYLAEVAREPDPVTGQTRNTNTVKVGFI